MFGYCGCKHPIISQWASSETPIYSSREVTMCIFTVILQALLWFIPPLKCEQLEGRCCKILANPATPLLSSAQCTLCTKPNLRHFSFLFFPLCFCYLMPSTYFQENQADSAATSYLPHVFRLRGRGMREIQQCNLTHVYSEINLIYFMGAYFQVIV